MLIFGVSSKESAIIRESLIIMIQGGKMRVFFEMYEDKIQRGTFVIESQIIHGRVTRVL